MTLDQPKQLTTDVIDGKPNISTTDATTASCGIVFARPLGRRRQRATGVGCLSLLLWHSGREAHAE